MLPRLTADESLLATERVSIGSGTMKSPRGTLARWQRQAQPAQRAERATAPTLGSMGIGLRRVRAHG